MESVQTQTSQDKDPDQEYRVRLRSKGKATELMNSCSEVLRSALDGQPELPEETRRVLLEELLANFEAAVRLNVLVGGQPWDEAPDLEGEEVVDLDGLLDDTILETTGKRYSYPKRILSHVVHALKAERKILGLYETSVLPEDIQKDPDQENIMNDVSAAAPGMVKQAIQVIKSIGTLHKQAEDLCEILHMKPSSTSLQIHREVLGATAQLDALPPAGGAVRTRQLIKRAVEEAAAAEGYVPDTKKPERSVGEDETE
ncbi:kinetochore-associated protein NSL1 homolog [Girardinichthys multiradiatus]|uniref:kinetochore-associated protein NSL1 homolog n=1 Tax=Girardinichthys multiradiatus TaxID=208333 RepID=UPI001FAC7B9A|nr:kinetochore-associated protein NSL1 homolog [Girardinichthys multiradiatus]